MGYASSALAHFAPARIVLVAIFVSSVGIALLLGFIVARRWLRSRYFARRDALAAYVRSHWDGLVNTTVLPQRYCTEGLAREVLEGIVLDRIAVAARQELAALVDCLRRSGVLDVRIRQARTVEGWKQRTALVILGRTRAAEAVPALAEGLESMHTETRIAAARGLGKIASHAAALPLLEMFSAGKLDVPWGVLKNALLSCCTDDATVLTKHLRVADGPRRELLARVLSELADEAQADELLVLAGDPSPEVRAAAARGLAHINAGLALSPLSQLAEDTEWFVRLRAVVALGAFVDQGALPVLVRVLSDRNRLVRQRAAWALIRSSHLMHEVVTQVVAAGDDYGLQAVVAELDRCGLYLSTLERLKNDVNAAPLIAALQRARARLSPDGRSLREGTAEPTPQEVCVA